MREVAAMLKAIHAAAEDIAAAREKATQVVAKLKNQPRACGERIGEVIIELERGSRERRIHNCPAP